MCDIVGDYAFQEMRRVETCEAVDAIVDSVADQLLNSGRHIEEVVIYRSGVSEGSYAMVGPLSTE